MPPFLLRPIEEGWRAKNDTEHCHTSTYVWNTILDLLQELCYLVNV